MSSENKRQIVSKKRVAEHGEVYTNEREVNAMLDLVKPETERIDSRFLEPACGNGNFMVEILRRKLAVVAKSYGNSPSELECYGVCAVSNIYGIDILEDNVLASRRRLFSIFNDFYCHHADHPREDVLATVRFILSRNILWGDALSLMTVDNQPRPIVFSEWTFIGDGKVKRRDYELAKLMQCTPMDGPNLFSDLGDEAFIPTPVKEFPVTDFLKLNNHEDNQLQS
jgi:hypothetical protein